MNEYIRHENITSTRQTVTFPTGAGKTYGIELQGLFQL